MTTRPDPWRQAIEDALFEAQLDPVGEGETPAAALARLMGAHEELLFAKHGVQSIAVKPYDHTKIKPTTLDRAWFEESAGLNPDEWRALPTADPRRATLSNGTAQTAQTAQTASEVLIRTEAALRGDRLARDYFARAASAIGTPVRETGNRTWDRSWHTLDDPIAAGEARRENLAHQVAELARDISRREAVQMEARLLRELMTPSPSPVIMRRPPGFGTYTTNFSRDTYIRRESQTLPEPPEVDDS